MRKMRFNESPKDKNFWTYDLYNRLVKVSQYDVHDFMRYNNSNIRYIELYQNSQKEKFIIIFLTRQIHITIDIDLLKNGYHEFLKSAINIGEYHYNKAA
ncbi:MAG: hypothetical protein ACRDD7_11615 [Peptostreptococcaceae bacterium]